MPFVMEKCFVVSNFVHDDLVPVSRGRTNTYQNLCSHTIPYRLFQVRNLYLSVIHVKTSEMQDEEGSLTFQSVVCKVQEDESTVIESH